MATIKPRRPTEAQLQKVIVDWIRAAAPQVLCFAIPNAAVRRPGARAGNAVPGLLRGVADLCVVADRGVAHFIEVKREGSPPSAVGGEQWNFYNRVKAMGGHCAIVRSLDEVKLAFGAWNIKTREA